MSNSKVDKAASQQIERAHKSVKRQRNQSANLINSNGAANKCVSISAK